MRHATVVRAPDGFGWVVVPLEFPGQAPFDPGDPASITPAHVERARQRAWTILEQNPGAAQVHEDLIPALDELAQRRAEPEASISDAYQDMRSRADQGIPSLREDQIQVPPFHERGVRFPLREVPPPGEPAPMPGRLPAPTPPAQQVQAPPTLARLPAPRLSTSTGRSLAPALVESLTGEPQVAAPSLRTRLAQRPLEPGRLARRLTAPF